MHSHTPSCSAHPAALHSRPSTEQVHEHPLDSPPPLRQAEAASQHIGQEHDGTPHLISRNFRPLQPLLFWQTCLLALLAGIVGITHLWMAVGAVALLFWIDSRTWRPLPALLLLLCGALGFWMGNTNLPNPPHTLPLWLQTSLEQRNPVRITGEVVSVQGLPDHRLRILLRSVQPLETGKPAQSEALPPTSPSAKTTQHEALSGMVAWTWDQPSSRPLAGQHVSATLSIRPVQGFRNRGQWSFQAFWQRQNVFFQAWSRGERGEPLFSDTGTTSDGLRNTLRTLLIDTMRDAEGNLSQGKAIVPALLFGDRFLLHTATLNRFNEAGLLHSLALSGQHLAVVGLAAWFGLFLLGYTLPNTFLRMPASLIFLFLSLPLALGYLWLGDAPPSLVRSVWMLGLWCALLWRGWWRVRGTTFFDVLFLTLAGMTAVWPLAIYDLGVQLSFLAVAGIALWSPLWQQIWQYGRFVLQAPPSSPLIGTRSTTSQFTPLSFGRRLQQRCLQGLWLTLGCSLAAQLATLPLCLEAFGRSTLWFPLNLIWVPVVGLYVLPLSFLGLFCLIPTLGGDGLSVLNSLGTSLLELASIPCESFLALLHWLHDVWGMRSTWGLRPHWTASLGFGALFVALAVHLGRRRLPPAGKRLLTAGMLLLLVASGLRLASAFDPSIALRVLDVGQGQALLLEYPPDTSSSAAASLWKQQCSVRALTQSIGYRRQRGLIDGGGLFSRRFDTGRDLIMPILTDNNQPYLNFMALTHPDRDHMKGLLFIAERVPCEVLYLPFTANNLHPFLTTMTETHQRAYHQRYHATQAKRAAPLLAIARRVGLPQHTLQYGDHIPLGNNAFLEVIAPAPFTKPRNNDGLILRLVTKNNAQTRGLALMTGDAEAPYLRALLKHRIPVQADVLVLPHHGSAGSHLPALYTAVAPRVAIASAGNFNPFRFPSQRVRDTLAAQAIPLRITGEEGAIDLRFMPEPPHNLFGWIPPSCD